MFLYYTTISGENTDQSKPELSLGGYKSANRVSNGVLNNMFSDVTPITVANYNQNRYIALVLKNETAADITNINVWFTKPATPIAGFKIAAVDMVADGTGALFMEHVSTVFSKPVYADFNEADGEANKVNIGNLLVGGQVGLWIEMELDIDAAKLGFETVYEPVPGDDYRFQEVVKEKIEEIGFSISWD